MNFLAHLYLSSETPGAMMGALMPDLCKGPLPSDLDPSVRRAVERHRFIDRFTDAHPVFHESRRRVEPGMRRFSGIVVDVFYDHFLARQWNRYASDSLELFIEHCYSALVTCCDDAPQSFALAVKRMIEHNWLLSYRDISGVEDVLRRMSRRMRRAVPLHDTVADLVQKYDRIESDFLAFFPELVAAVDNSPASMAVTLTTDAPGQMGSSR